MNPSGWYDTLPGLAYRASNIRKVKTENWKIFTILEQTAGSFNAHQALIEYLAENQPGHEDGAVFTWQVKWLLDNIYILLKCIRNIPR